MYLYYSVRSKIKPLAHIKQQLVNQSNSAPLYSIFFLNLLNGRSR